MIDTLSQLSRIGVTDNLSERDSRRIVFLNRLILALLPFDVGLILLMAAWLPATWPILFVAIAYFVCLGLTLLWTHLRRYLAARIWFCGSAAVSCILAAALVGSELRFQLFLIVCIFLMFYKFPAQERSWMYGFIGIYTAGIIVVELMFREGGIVAGLPPQFLVAQYYYNIAGLLIFAILVGGLGYLTLSNAEERLAFEHAELQDKSRQLAELFEELQDKSRQLEAANLAKSRFVASASHDLRQPLHALNLFVAQLCGETDPAEQRRLLPHIEEAVKAMNELFNGLWDLSRLDADVLVPNLSEFPIDRLLKRIELTCGPTAREKGLRLKVISNPAYVRSDPILLERVLLNLVSNAIRYTAKGGVAAGCRRRGDTLRIEVWDTGVGIAEDQRSKIFGEFYRGPANEQDRSGGAGLGLAIVDRMCRLLHHSMELISRLGSGSRFSVSVPIALTPRRPEQAAEIVTDRLAGKVVLVIDDDAAVLNGMGGVLRNWGCLVLTAGSEPAALSCVAEQYRKPDLIISDYWLKDGANGIQVIDRLRQVLTTPVSALLISGDTAPERLQEAQAKGYHLLHKPVMPMTLRAMVNRLIKNTSKAGDVGEPSKGYRVQSETAAQFARHVQI